MHHPPLVALLCALLLAASAPASAGGVTSFERSVHEGSIDGAGVLVGMDYLGIESGSATLTFESAHLEQAWQNNSVQTFASDGSIEIAGVNDVQRGDSPVGPTTLHLTTNQRDANLLVFAVGDPSWNMKANRGTLSTPDSGQEMKDRGPLLHPDGQKTVPLEGASLWQSGTGGTNTVTGDFVVSLFGWSAADDDGVLFHTGRSNSQDAGPAQVEDISNAWLHVRGGTLNIEFAQGAATRTYVHSPTITTVGTTTLTGLPTQPTYVMEGTTTLAVTSSGDHLEAVVTEGAPAIGAGPSSTAVALPAGSVWLWGGLGAMLFVAAFVFVALAARSTPMLEWRSYHALDRHRPLLAAFWANLWARRDPWDGHAWSARGEARMMMHHDRGAARDFTKAHALLPPEERAVNALHAARSHARVGHATQTAHWIGIVASHDINVLLTAREEPDFARVWDHASVQRAVQQVLGV